MTKTRDASPEVLDELTMTEVSGVDRPAHKQQGWFVMKAEDATEATEATEASDTVTISKSAYEGILEKLESRDSKIDSLTKAIEVLTHKAEIAKARTRADAWQSLPGLDLDTAAEHFVKMSDSTSEWLGKTFDQLSKAFAAADAFAGPTGTSASESDSADHQLQAKAQEFVKKGEAASESQGMVLALERYPELASQYVQERDI